MGRYLFLICFSFFADFIVFVFFEAGTLTEFAVNRLAENKDKKQCARVNHLINA